MTEKKAAHVASHDGVFKKILSDPQAARDLLDVHLPAAWRKQCDLSTLEVKSGSFVEADLKPYYSDMLFRVKMVDGAAGYILVTVEHQSRPDRLIGFRLMRYAIAAMQRHIEEGNDTVPVVIPLLFYAGKQSPHPYPVNWLACFDNQALAREVYSQDFPLADITVIPDDELKQHKSVALLSLVMKHIRTRDMLDFLDDIARLMLESRLTDEHFIAIINYIIQKGERTQNRDFLVKLARQVPQHEGRLMTIADQLREEGKQQGILLGEQRGIEKGRNEGKLEGKLEVARTMLACGMDKATIMQITGLTDAQISQIH